MISFSRVMTNGSTKIFKVSASAAPFAALLSVGATRLAVHFTKHLCAPPRVQSLYALLELADSGNGIFVFAIDIESIAQPIKLSVQVDGKYVRHRDIVYVAHAPLRRVFGRYVVF
jgi:hypothetical protein